jgi:hypothetical protein
MDYYIETKNSKTLSNGNRLNLVINHTTKEFYYNGCNAFNIGFVTNNLLKRDIIAELRILKELDYQEVPHYRVVEWGLLS